MAAASDRMLKLAAMLDKSPNDAFLLYGLAMEHKKAGDAGAAIEYLDRTIAADRGYCYAYYQKGLLLQNVGDIESARRVYREGIAAAEAKGDAHGRSEIAAALEMI